MELLTLLEYHNGSHGVIAIGRTVEELEQFLKQRISDELSRKYGFLDKDKIIPYLRFEFDDDVISAYWHTEGYLTVEFKPLGFARRFLIDKPPLISPI